MAALDYFKREIKVGDLLVPLNSSSFWSYGGKPMVCTRIGSNDKVQVNGSSYGNAEYFLVVNEQAAHAGMDCEALRDVHREVFNYNPVEDKKPSPRFVLMRIWEYSTYSNGKVVSQDNEPEFFVISYQGDNKEMYNRVKEVTSITSKQEYCNRYSYTENSSGSRKGFSGYSAVSMSRKALLSIDPELDLMIDQKIDKFSAPQLWERLCKIDAER